MYKGGGYACTMYVWGRINELEMSLAWDIFDGWSLILNDMLIVCIGTSWLIDNAWVRFM